MTDAVLILFAICLILFAVLCVLAGLDGLGIL